MTSFWSQIQNEKSECFLPIISCFQQCKKNYLRRCWKRFCEGWSGSTGKASTSNSCSNSNSSTCFSSLFLTAGETSCSVARVSDVRENMHCREPECCLGFISPVEEPDINGSPVCLSLFPKLLCARHPPSVWEI